jgi:SAM-dependent methyltransferase
MFRSNTDLSNEEVRLAYEHLYRQGWPGPRQAVFVWLMRRVPLQPGDILLDVACGDAQLCSLVESRGGQYYGIDLARTALHQRNCLRLTVGDGQTLPFPSHHFHWVTCIGSLEHFLDMDKGLQEIARVLKPEGGAVILVPNLFAITWNLINVWRNGRVSDDDGQPVQGYATRASWEALLNSNGLEVTKVVGYERACPNTKYEWSRYWLAPKELFLALLGPFIPLNLRRAFVFFCRRTSQS